MPRGTRSSISRRISACTGIERAGRLIGDQQFRIRRQHHRDHHALTHAARDSSRRIGVQHGCRITDRHLRQQIDCRLSGQPAAATAMRAPGLGDLRAGGHHRIEREFRVLQDEPGTCTTNTPEARSDRREYVNVVECQLVGGDDRIGGSRRNRARGEGLAGTGFTDNAELLLTQRERTLRNASDRPVAVGNWMRRLRISTRASLMARAKQEEFSQHREFSLPDCISVFSVTNPVIAFEDRYAITTPRLASIAARIAGETCDTAARERTNADVNRCTQSTQMVRRG